MPRRAIVRLQGMKVYIGLASPVGSGAAVSARVATIIDRLVEISLPQKAGPWIAQSWRSRDAATALLAWSNEPQSPRLVKPLLTGDERALGVSGYLTDPGDARRLLSARDLGATADQLSGVFALFRADQDGFTAVTSVVRADAVYHASAGEVLVAGNRALLVHLVAGSLAAREGGVPEVLYDLEGVASLIRHSYIIGDETPFAGVRTLPAHSTLEARHGRMTVITRPLGRAEVAEPADTDRKRHIRELADGLVAAIRPLSSVNDRIDLSLTGGRDSRMIAAALHASGIPFHTATNGAAEDPDVVVAGQVARALGRPHSFRPPQRTEDGEAVVIEDPLFRTMRIIHTVEGMVSTSYNVATSTRFRSAPRLTGAGGEQLRGGFLTNQDNISSAAIEKRIRTMFVGCDSLLTEWARGLARNALRPWAEHARRAPLEALDTLYLYHRSGRWAGATRGATDVSGVMLYPLFDNVLTRRVLSVSPRWRWTEQPIHGMIASLAPALRDVPLAGRRWRYLKRSPLLFGRRSWRAQTPVTAEARSAAVFDWRKTPDTALVAMLREQILDGPSALMEIIDRVAVERLLAELPLKRTPFVWAVYTGSVLLSNVWLSTAEARPKIAVKIA